LQVPYYNEKTEHKTMQNLRTMKISRTNSLHEWYVGIQNDYCKTRHQHNAKWGTDFNNHYDSIAKNIYIMHLGER
jgi:hypothetical protein